MNCGPGATSSKIHVSEEGHNFFWRIDRVVEEGGRGNVGQNDQ
jgi:hypothetical protein